MPNLRHRLIVVTRPGKVALDSDDNEIITRLLPYQRKPFDLDIVILSCQKEQVSAVLESALWDKVSHPRLYDKIYILALSDMVVRSVFDFYLQYTERLKREVEQLSIFVDGRDPRLLVGQQGDKVRGTVKMPARLELLVNVPQQPGEGE